MSWNKTVLSALLTLIIHSAALAENATAQAPIRTRPSTAPGTTKPRLEPCWEVAGVSEGGHTASSNDYTAGTPAG